MVNRQKERKRKREKKKKKKKKKKTWVPFAFCVVAYNLPHYVDHAPISQSLARQVLHLYILLS
jgi:Na+/H+ antiporter NhaD/arsenite permease-like protein